MPRRSSKRVTAAQQVRKLQARVTRLEGLCADAYQVAGAAGAPERVLDALYAAAQGYRIPRAALLPITEAESTVAKREAPKKRPGTARDHDFATVARRGQARAEALSPAKRKAIAKKAAETRWKSR